MDKCVCTISIEKPGSFFTPKEADGLLSDIKFFLQPYLVEVLREPEISSKNQSIFTTSFECFQPMQESIEAFIDCWINADQKYIVKQSYDQVDPIIGV